ncbi:sugar transferase [Thermaerobacter composti]|uniref:Sugar transferase n=1 Tax=Thermaerobacter composti TaxID=554949 RepID=A0ABZ0QTA1_9FIRM|nr:sugar transferase [Thermaerobacter composti]WPD19715.1 sugar transferase [Thermaerobacter composti]
MRGPATPFRDATAGPQGLPPFTRNEPITFRAFFGSYSRLVLLGVGDAVLALTGYVTGTYVGGLVHGTPVPLDPGPWLEYPLATVVPVMSGLVFLALYRGYRDLHRSYFELGRDVFTAGLWSTFLTTAVLHFYEPGSPALAAGSAWLPAGVITACLVTMWRVPFGRWARNAWRERPVTPISTQSEVWRRRLPSYVAVHSWMSPKAFLQARPATQRVMVTPDVRVEDRERIVGWALRNEVEVFLVPDVYEVLVASARSTQLSDILLVEMPRLGLPVELRAIKRVMDVVGAIILFCVFIPAFLVVPLLIWVEDRGPVLYRQQRVGRDGKLFDLIKFRTMVPDAERELGPVWAQQEDPRITRIGQLLRSTHLDELPQLVNVLRGDMSLVGPRPERPALVKEFVARNPVYRVREAVKPGITGLAQVLGRYDTDPDAKIRFDLRYVRSWSFSLDMLLVL